MTMHFNDIELPSALDDELPGCPSASLRGGRLTKRIDAVCTEPGCPNAPAPLWQRALPALLRPRPADIYQTQPKDRCVM